MKTETELRYLLEGAKEERSDCLSELEKCDTAHEEAIATYSRVLRSQLRGGTSDRRERLWATEPLQDAQDNIIICLKQLKAAQLVVDDILSQLDEHYHTFISQIPGKIVRESGHPEQDLSWAKRTYGRAVKRVDTAQAEYSLQIGVENLLEGIWLRENRRKVFSLMVNPYHRQWLQARDSRTSTLETLAERIKELEAISHWHDQAHNRMRRWEDQQRQHRDHQRTETRSAKPNYWRQHQRQQAESDSRRKEKPETRARSPSPAEAPLKEISPEAVAVSIAQWRERVEAAFADYTVMASFPTPPESACNDTRCESQTKSALNICDCSIRTAFKRVGNLKIERTRWHPDRFGICPAEHREEYQKKAQVIFVVVSEMYERSKLSVQT